MQTLNLPGPKAREIIDRDHSVISRSYPRAFPFVMDYGRGVEVWDVDGNRFLDFAAGIAVVATGHSHPKVVDAIKQQADNFVHISPDFYHPKMVELAEKINQIAPFSENALSLMANSGAESVETALKLARYYTGRTQLISFLGGFHGRTMGAVTLTASKPKYHHGFYPLLNGVVHVPYPDPYRQVLQSHPGEDYGETVVRYIDEQIFGHILPGEDVAGIIVEPIQGEGGYIVPEEGFFPALRRLCDRYGILLIADEVQSGMGRTGKWWAIEHFGVEPDIVCTAKGLASGMPMGITFAREHIMNWPKGTHGNTFGGNPIACAAAIATIDLIEGGYKQNAHDVGMYTLGVLEEIQNRHPSIGQVRGKGLMIGIDFVTDCDSKTPDEEMRNLIIDRAFERGLMLLGCGESAIRIAPPLMVDRDEIDEGLEILDEAIGVSEMELRAVVT
ncbi:acetyl ornithine aminotransferase family protein [Chloroflexota bacterium]